MLFHKCSIKIFCVFFLIDFALYGSGWYCMNVVLVLDWINVDHSFGIADMSLSYVFSCHFILYLTFN